MKRMYYILGAIGLIAALAVSVAATHKNHKSINYTEVVDLSHVIDTNIPLWPGDPPVVFETVADFATDGFYLRRFSIGEHSATHMNAANSFHANGTGIDAYEPESLVVKAVVIDIRDKAEVNPDYALTIADVLAWEKKHGKIPAKSVVLLYTGWQEKWGDPVAFFNEDADKAFRLGQR